jgi:hypothetical protein
MPFKPTRYLPKNEASAQRRDIRHILSEWRPKLAANQPNACRFLQKAYYAHD